MEKTHYVILSEGAYSDYKPRYFVGPVIVTQEELNEKALEIGDEMWKQFNDLPERPTINWQGQNSTEKYDPQDPEKYIGWSPSSEEFIKKMAEWLYSLGYTELPKNIPEVNVYYDVPRSA